MQVNGECVWSGVTKAIFWRAIKPIADDFRMYIKVKSDGQDGS